MYQRGKRARGRHANCILSRSYTRLVISAQSRLTNMLQWSCVMLTYYMPRASITCHVECIIDINVTCNECLQYFLSVLRTLRIYTFCCTCTESNVTNSYIAGQLLMLYVYVGCRMQYNIRSLGLVMFGEFLDKFQYSFVCILIVCERKLYELLQ